MSDDRGKYQAAYDLMLRIACDEDLARRREFPDHDVRSEYNPCTKAYWLDLYTECLKRMGGERASRLRRVRK